MIKIRKEGNDMLKSRKLMFILILTIVFNTVLSSIVLAYSWTGIKWPIASDGTYYTVYKSDGTLPSSWATAVRYAAGTWNNKSKFTFYVGSSTYNTPNTWGTRKAGTSAG
jgi:hypothetical protein